MQQVGGSTLAELPQRAAEHADWFDIDWSQGPIVLPILGDEPEPELSIVDGELRYHEHRFPLAPRSLPLLLRRLSEHPFQRCLR